MNRYVILSAFVITLLLIGVIIWYLLQRNQTIDSQPPHTPTPAVRITPATDPSVRYPVEDQEKLSDYIKNRKALTQADAQIRAQIITGVGGKTGIVHTTETYQIEYILSANAFMVAVRNIEIDQVKMDVNTWFQEQGLSQDGICKLPVTFYLTPNTKRELPEGTIFSPLARGC